MYIPVLSGGSGDDLSRSIVEVPIVIVMEHAGIEQLLLPNRNQYFISKAVLESIQEGQLSSKVRSPICSL